MDIIKFLIIAGFIHCTLFFFNTIFRSCLHYPYFLFLENTGLEIKILSVKWFTSAFNRTFVKWTINKTKFWELWFNTGALVSITIILPVTLLMILKTSLGIITNALEIRDISQRWDLEPMIPGVNVPFSDIKYHIVALGLCSIVHEVGHALAACREDVQLYGVGLVLAYIVPVAFVSINSDQLKQLSFQKQLRILCAGVWHNIVLAIVAALIYFSRSSLWILLFYNGSGIYVKSFNANSPLLGENGLHSQDIIHRIDDCSVTTTDDWYNCIVRSIKDSTSGYCVKQSLIEEYDESIKLELTTNGDINCCSSSSLSQGNICFEAIEKIFPNSLHLPSHSCLPARKIVEHSNQACQLTSLCTEPDTFCMKPSVSNVTKIVRISRKHGKDVLFFGNPADIYRTVDVSNWIPKYNIFDTDLPESMELLFSYIAVLSAGLAVINIIPCYFFDGQHIVILLIESILRSLIRSKSVRRTITLTVTSLGTSLLIFNLTHALIKIL